MKYVLSLILLLLSACSGGMHKTELSIVGFEPYVKKFEDYSCIYNETCIKVTNLIIKLENLEPPKNGNCRLFSDGRTPEITFDKTYWLNVSETQREVLALHELGHGFLGRMHNDKMMNNCPISIMNSYTLPQNCYIYYKDSYLKEYYE